MVCPETKGRSLYSERLNQAHPSVEHMVWTLLKRPTAQANLSMGAHSLNLGRERSIN